MTPGRALGLGLIALGAVLSGLVLLWLIVNAVGGQLQAGGFVLGLMILAVLGLPPVGVGLYVLRRSERERAETERFERRRRVLESDQMFRTEVARDLRQVERRLADSATGNAALVRARARVRDLVEDVEQVGYDRASWYDAVQLQDNDIDALRQYDDLLRDGLRRLTSEANAAAEAGEVAALTEALERWEENLAQRQDLLLRGQRSTTAAPAELLRSRRTPKEGGLASLAPNDAVSFDGRDFLIELTVRYFGGGKTWWLHRLRAGADERWLWVAPEGLSTIGMTAIERPGDPRSEMIRYKGAACRPSDQGDATATINGPDGSHDGIAVQYWRFTCPDGSTILIEHWPDEKRAYVGRGLKPGDVEVFRA